MNEALRFNTDKPMMSYFMRSFPKMAEAVARVKEMGAIKYNDGNWRLGNKPDKEYWDSMFRHLTYIFGGKDYDKDTGCLHIAHAVWNLCALLELNYPDLPARDDAIWADRAIHWAEEKRKREEQDTVVKGSKGGGTSKPTWTTFIVRRGGELECVDPCPMCGYSDDILLNGDRGLECHACGEIFGVPIVPENETTEAPQRNGPLDDAPYAAYAADAVAASSYAAGRVKRVVEDLLSKEGPETEVPDKPSKEIEAAEATEAVEGWGPACAARWAKEEKQKLEAQKTQKTQEAPNGSLEKFVAAMKSLEATVSDTLFSECPMCGRRVGKMLPSRQGLECPKCGEIFEVPIVPEGEGFIDDASRGLVFDKFVRVIATRDDEVWPQYEEKRKGVEPPEFAICPMCNCTYAWRSAYGLECGECGEVFDVPIVPENTDGPETVRFGLKGERRLVFVNTMAELFETSNIPENAGPEVVAASEGIRFILKNTPRPQSFIDLLDRYFFNPLGRD